MLELHAKTGLYVRTDTVDVQAIGEVRAYRALGMTEADTVLDLGAHIGAFAWYASTHGVGAVFCYEPDAANYELLQLNADELNAHTRTLVYAHPYAVTRDGRTATLNVKAGQSTSSHSLYTHRPTDVQRAVRTVAFKRALQVRPTLVKIDIEGAEYELPLEDMPPTVRGVAMELHLSRQAWKRTEAPRIVDTMRQLGFVPVVTPHVGPQYWRHRNTEGVWLR